MAVSFPSQNIIDFGACWIDLEDLGSGSKHPYPPQLSQDVEYGCRGHLIDREWLETFPIDLGNHYT